MWQFDSSHYRTSLNLLILFILMSSIIYCQVNKDGYYAELNLLYVNHHTIENEIISWNPFQRKFSEYDNYFIDSGISFGFSGKINFSKSLLMNYKPGLTINNNSYAYLDLGIYLRCLFTREMYFNVGFIPKATLSVRQGNYNYSKPRRESFEYSLGGGYQLNDKVALTFNLNIPIRTIYGESFSDPNMNTKSTKQYVFWILKTGLDFRF